MSRRSIWTALGAALLLAWQSGCFHARKVEQPDRDDQEQQSSGSGGDARQPKESEGGSAAEPHLARRPQKPGRPPLAAGPGGLFVPGGVEKVQRALADKGYLDLGATTPGRLDAATSAAVRKFQDASDLARTGNPDHETLRKLGLNPDELFRKSSAVKQGDKGE